MVWPADQYPGGTQEDLKKASSLRIAIANESKANQEKTKLKIAANNGEFRAPRWLKDEWEEKKEKERQLEKKRSLEAQSEEGELSEEVKPKKRKIKFSKKPYCKYCNQRSSRF